MPRTRQQRVAVEMRRSLASVFVAAVLLAMLSHLCLARVDAATDSSLGPPWEKGAVTAVGEVGQEAAVVRERMNGYRVQEAAVVHERMEREASVNDYPDSGPNRRHNPTHP